MVTIVIVVMMAVVAVVVVARIDEKRKNKIKNCKIGISKNDIENLSSLTSLGH